MKLLSAITVNSISNIQQLLRTAIAFGILTVGITSSAFVARAADDLTLPKWVGYAGAGGYFFEANQEYDPGALYQLMATHNFNTRWSTDIYLGGMPQLNDNPSTGIVPPPADVHNWGMQTGVQGNYHFNGDGSRRWDPFVGVGGGIQGFRKSIEGDNTQVYANAGGGLEYRFNPRWSTRGDYRVAFVSGDDAKWNQSALVSVGYNWGDKSGRDASFTGEEEKPSGRKSTIENADLQLKPVYFDFDQSSLRDDSRATLNRNVEWIRLHPDTHIILEGHCDERGTTEYNLALGQRRAKAAFDYLRSVGIPASQLSTVTYGEERPADPNHNEAAWAKNRRVECRGR